MARLSSYTKDTTLTGKDMLAGSNYIGTVNGIDQFETNNFTLEKITQHINGQIVTDPSVISLKTNGGLVYETSNNTNYLAVNLSHTNITGQLANSDLVNSYITINGTNVQLGGSISIPVGDITAVTAGTYLNGGGTTGDITVNHDNTSRSDTTSTAAPTYGATFTAIDSITTNATGHITAANLKTVTIPASDNTTYDLDLTQNSSDVDLKLDASTGTDTTIKFKAGSNVTLTRGVVNNIEQVTIASQAFGTVHTVGNQTQHLALNTSSGDLVIRTDQSKTYIDNGNNVSPNEMGNYTELQFSGINSIDLTEGDGITLSRTGVGALTNTNNDLTITNNLATASERGGIRIGYTESGKNYPVELDSEKAYVNVPWVNTNQLTEWVLTDDDNDNTTINHGKHVKFVMATGPLGTNTTGAGTDADPYLVTLTSPDNNTTYTNGSGLDLNGTEFSHTDTSSQASVNNSGRTYIQDITLDTYGHVTGLVSATETVVDTNQLTTWDLLDDDDDSFTISHDKHVKFTSGTGAYGTNITGAGTSSDPYVVAITSPNDTVPNTFRTIKVDTNNDGTANETIGATEELKLIGGTNVTLAENAGTVTITSTDTNTTNWNFKVDSGTAENISAGETVTFTGGTNVTLTQNGNTIDIASAYTNTTYDLSVPENTTNIRLAGSDGTNDAVTITGGTNVTVTRNNASQLTISSTNTTYTAGTGLSLSGTTFNANVDGTQTTAANTSTTTANRTYKVQVDSNDNLVVNVPWVDTTDPDNNNYVTGASVSGTTTKTLTLTRQGLSDLTAQWTDIDTNTQRTDEEIRDVAAAQWINGTNTTVVVSDANDTIKINATNTNDIDYINAASFNTSNGILTLSGVGNAGATVDLDGRYLTSYSETDTLATVTSRGASTTTDTTFNSNLSIASAGHWLYIVPNAANTTPSHAHGMAMAWNYSGGSRESNIIFAAGSDANASQEADCQIRFEYKPVSGNPSTVAKLWSGGNMNIAGYLTVQNGGNTITNTKVGQWDTAYGWGNHASAGYLTSFDITTQTDPKYLRSNANDTSSGSLTVVSYKFNGNASNPTNTTATIYDQANQGPTISGLGVCFRTGSVPSQTGKLNSSGTFTVSGDVVAYGSPSDISLKENIKPIENALDKVEKLQGITFDWKEKQEDILNIKEDIGFIAQDVQKVLPELVRENDNGKLSLRHQGIIPVLLEAIKELSNRIKVLENGGTE